MQHFYHIRCDTELGKGFCAMMRIPCACSGCVEQISKPWLPNLEKTQQPSYVIEPGFGELLYTSRTSTRYAQHSTETFA